MDKRILLCGLAAFTLTLAFSFWHDRRYDAAPVARAALEPDESRLAPSGAMTTPAAAAAPAIALMNPPPAIAPSEPTPSDRSASDPDNMPTLARRDRGGGRGSRSH